MAQIFEVPEKLDNWIGGESIKPSTGQYLEKRSPHSGELICKVARSGPEDVSSAIKAAQGAQKLWASTPAPRRGEILFEMAYRMKGAQNDIAKIVALETGKSFKDALGETGGAISQALFMAGEGQRLFGRTAPSGQANRYPLVVREPVGVCGLIIAANTPIANCAWKVFPALISGNTAILKPSEDTPLTAALFARIAHEAGVPAGVLNLVNGLGQEVGAPLVQSHHVPLISFTGSTAVGRWIAQTAGERLAKVCLELGGKNPLVICDDADLENAVKWALLSSFSNAGQRCAASSRILVFSSIYERFKELFLERISKLKVGPTDEDDLGPVINERQLSNMLAAVEKAKNAGAKILCGGARFTDSVRAKGSYMMPTVLENIAPTAEFSCQELFGPITALYKVESFAEALEVANNNPYGLTASIHTKNFHRAVEFSRKAQAGMVVVNAGTFGSEPHMPFGGVKLSGNGTREPGPEALDVYTNIKTIYEVVLPELA